jgi:nitroreductase
MDVLDALARRRSVRAFRPDPVSQAEVRTILSHARRAPSGGNLQPWKVYAVAGGARARVIAAVRARLAAEPALDETRYSGYPPKLHEPYRTRRYALGEAMYGLMGIPREDKPARLAHVARNFEFFGAPVGLFFAIDERFEHPQVGHLGMFMLAVALVAESMGLSTCMQEIWQRVQATTARALGLPGTEKLIAGMALGHADETAPVNRLRSERVPVEEFAVFEGFEGFEHPPSPP